MESLKMHEIPASFLHKMSSQANWYFLIRVTHDFLLLLQVDDSHL